MRRGCRAGEEGGVGAFECDSAVRVWRKGGSGCGGEREGVEGVRRDGRSGDGGSMLDW